MLLPVLILFFLFLLLSAFFSSSETAFLSSDPYKLDYLSQTGSVKAKSVQKLLKRLDSLLAAILIGNTLVNTAAASLATLIFVSFIEDKNQAIFFSTLVTTFLILILSEITPKTYAAYHPIRLAMLFVRPLKFFVILLFPVVKIFMSMTRLLFPSATNKTGRSRSLDKEEARVLFSGIQDLSSFRKRVISGALDIGSRSVQEAMIPRPQIKALEAGSTRDQILDLFKNTGFSRVPVYSERMDNIVGLVHAKGIIPYLMDNTEIHLQAVMRPPLFIPESASLEKALLKMKKTANHMLFIVDEFGNMEGIVTLEDILEEIVGEIQDEYDKHPEPQIRKIGDGYRIRGNTPVKYVNQETSIPLPEKKVYTTIAGFLLDVFERIPLEGEYLDFGGYRFHVEKMTKRYINVIRVHPYKKSEKKDSDEAHCEE